MAVFQDNNGQSWRVALDVTLIRRVRDLFGINLVALRSDPFDQLANDPVLQVDVLYVLCEKQAAERNMSDQDFGRCLGADLEPSAIALQEAVVNFFQPGKRSFIRSLMEEHAKVRDKSQEMMLAKIKDPDLQNRVASAMSEKAEKEMEQLIKNLESTDFANSQGGESAMFSTDETGSTPATGTRESLR